MNLSISLSKQQREKVRLIGGVAAVRKLIDSAPIPAKPETENDQPLRNRHDLPG